jgi:multidrug efflux pump subunit AcrB
MMAAYMMKDSSEHTKAGSSKMTRLYDRMLLWALRHRIITITGAIILFVFSIVLFRSMPTSLISNVDRGELILNVELAPGSEISDTRTASEKLTAIIEKHPEVKKVVALIGTPAATRGGGVSGGGVVNTGTLYITLVDKTHRKISQQAFEDLLRSEITSVAGVRLTFSRAGGMGGKPVRVALTSQDPLVLNQTAEAIKDQMRQVPGLSDVTTSAALLRPEILVHPDFDKAAAQGVSVQAIARTALIATLGDSDANLAKFNLSDRQINIRVQLDPKYRNDLQTIGNLQVLGNGNRLLPLNSVASIEFGTGPFQVDRYDRQRQVTLESSLDSNVTLGEALKKVHELPAFKDKPESVKEQPLGDAEIQRDVFAGFGTAIGAAVLLIYAVLVVLFGGFLHPLVIMMSLPLSLCGALMGLVLFNQSVGLYALIGITMLMGLVTKNAILLVEYALMEIHKGVPRQQAIIRAGETRMRPILMTTIAMIAGMMPIAMGIGAGSEARAPMAISVIGGLITSTLLTLVVIPVVFTYVDDFQKWLLRVFNRSRAVDSETTKKSDTVGSGRF